MNLMWKDPVVPHRSSSQSQRPLKTGRDELSFKFVRGRPSRRRQPRQSKKASAAVDEAPARSELNEIWLWNELNQTDGLISNDVDSFRGPASPAGSSAGNMNNGNDAMQMVACSSRSLDDLLTIPDLDGSQPAELVAPSTEGEMALTANIPDFFLLDMPASIDFATAAESPDSDDEQDTFSFGDASFPLQITYQNLAHKYHSVLDLCKIFLCLRTPRRLSLM